MLKKLFAAMLSLCLALGMGAGYAEEQTAQEYMDFGAFEAQDIREGAEPVTEALFADADITLINYWATWCPPCRAELPDLAKLGEQSEGRVQVLGVLMDAYVDSDITGEVDPDAIEAAHLLIEDSQIEFPVVYPNQELMMWAALVEMTEGSFAFPTTLIVDAQGRVITYVVGARSGEDWLGLAEEVSRVIAEK